LKGCTFNEDRRPSILLEWIAFSHLSVNVMLSAKHKIWDGYFKGSAPELDFWMSLRQSRRRCFRVAFISVAKLCSHSWNYNARMWRGKFKLVFTKTQMLLQFFLCTLLYIPLSDEKNRTRVCGTAHNVAISNIP
jgi:hypothetical protein